MNSAVDKFSRSTGRFPLQPGFNFTTGDVLPDGLYGTFVRVKATAAAKLAFENIPDNEIVFSADETEYLFFPEISIYGRVIVKEGTVNLMW